MRSISRNGSKVSAQVDPKQTLLRHLRDDLGLTYSIGSSSDARLDPGSFEISTFTRHDKLADTISDTKKFLPVFRASLLLEQTILHTESKQKSKLNKKG